MKVRLLDIAHSRSGDKGNTSNIGLIARKPGYYDVLVEQVTAERVKEHFAGVCLGKVERFELPNLSALNFLLHEALDGGGTLSLRADPQGKTLGTALLRMEIEL
jgi:predicted SpoU family rRNA methylase